MATVPSQMPPDKAYSCTPLMALISDAAGRRDRLGFTPKEACGFCCGACWPQTDRAERQGKGTTKKTVADIKVPKTKCVRCV